MLSKELVSLNSYIGYNRRVVINTSAKDSVVQRLTSRAKEEISSLIDLSLTLS